MSAADEAAERLREHAAILKAKRIGPNGDLAVADIEALLAERAVRSWPFEFSREDAVKILENALDSLGHGLIGCPGANEYLSTLEAIIAHIKLGGAI